MPKIQAPCMISYGIGWMIDWAYWVAIYSIEYTGSIIWGAFVGVGWPLHVLISIWQIIL